MVVCSRFVTLQPLLLGGLNRDGSSLRSVFAGRWRDGGDDCCLSIKPVSLTDGPPRAGQKNVWSDVSIGNEEGVDESRRQGSIGMRALGKMAVAQPTSEEELATLLPEEPELFIRLLFEDYRRKLAACVGKHGRGLLNQHDIKDALQETLIAVWDKIREPDFAPDRPLRMVFIIARNKAIDSRRKKLRLARRGVNETDVTDLVISDMAGSNLAIDYRYADEEEKRRLDEVLPGIVADLPERQKLAVNGFLECYEEIRERNKHRLVADAMSRMCGEVVDVAAAKSALRAGLEKVKADLVRRGIRFLDRRMA